MKFFTETACSSSRPVVKSLTTVMFKLITFAGLALPLTAHSDYRKGFESYRRGDEKGAVVEFRNSAESQQFDGYQEVIKNWLALGEFNYRWLNGSDRESKRANAKLLRWIGVAAKGGPAETQWQLSQLWQSTPDIEQTEERLRWMRLAAENGHVEAAWQLATRELHGSATKNEREKLLRNVAELGHIEAQRQLSNRYFEKRRPSNDGESAEGLEALYWARKLAEREDPVGMENLALLYYEGKVIQRDDKEILKWLTRVSEMGAGSNVVPQILAEIYERGLGVLPDQEKAKKLRKREQEVLRRQSQIIIN